MPRQTPTIPRVALGTFRSTGDQAAAAVRFALRQANLRAFDLASIYKNEVVVGREIRDAIRDGIVSRSELFVTSKISPYEMGAGRASAAVDGILERLDIGYLDLLLIHWPGAAKLPPSSEEHAIRREETWRVMEERVRSGQLRSIGVSNYGISHLEELLASCEIRPACNQVECHPLYPQEELRMWCAARDIQVVAYSSFGTGKLFDAPAVVQVAREAGDTQASVLLRWALQKNLCVLPKSITPERIIEYDPTCLERPLPNLPGRYLSHAHEALLDDMVKTDGPTKYCWDSSDVR